MMAPSAPKPSLLRRIAEPREVVASRCPLCGLHVESIRKSRGDRRSSFAGHVTTAHSDLNDRERSLVADHMILFAEPPRTEVVA